MKRRSKDDIIASILQCVMEQNRLGLTSYRIMRKAHITFEQAEEYLAILVLSKLLEYDTTANAYRITPKGHEFLKSYTNITEMVSAMDKSLRGTFTE